MELWPWVPRLRQGVAWWASFRRVVREYFIEVRFDFRLRFVSILDDVF